MNKRILCLQRLLVVAQKQYHSAGTAATSLNNRKTTTDFRSDTLTKPSNEMMQRILNADVGDDVYKEDPTVNQLEIKCAELFGMEKALFVPSGTMGNLICLLSHCTRRGDELIIGADQHVYCYEQGHFMQFGGIPARVIPNDIDGSMKLEHIQNAITDDSDFHQSKTRLICIENTHMRAGGVPLKLDYLNQVGQLAKNCGVKLHVDGARLYNAAVALNCSLKELLTQVDSVSMCLSKGLGCPVGSVIAGNDEFIFKAMRLRKALGGGMRQSGFLAAAGLYSLEIAHETLSADHKNAKILANGIQELSRPDVLTVNLYSVQTNIVFVKCYDEGASTLCQLFKNHGLLATPFDSSTIRFVTHLNVNEYDVNRALEIIGNVVKHF